MKRQLLTLTSFLCLLLLPLASRAKDLQLHMTTMENDTITVEVAEEPGLDRLVVSMSSRDSVCFEECLDLLSAKVLDGKFLEVMFSRRFGSGINAKEYALLCVSHGKLYTAIDCVAEYREMSLCCLDEYKTNERDVYEYDDTFWGLTYALEKRERGYNLTIEDHDYVRLVRDPDKLNHETWDTLTLGFDSTRLIFYNAIDTLSGDYEIVDHAGGYGRVIHFDNEEVPAINFRRGTRVYLTHKGWFFRGVDLGPGELYQYRVPWGQ